MTLSQGSDPASTRAPGPAQPPARAPAGGGGDTYSDPMHLGKSTRYALTAALEMARAKDGLVTVAEVSQHHAIPAGALAKALQALVRAGVATGTRGVGGGYRLARAASAISVLDVVEVFQPLGAGSTESADASRDPASTEQPLVGLVGLLDEVDEYVRCTFASVSLQTLARVKARPGSRRRAASG